MVQEHRHRAESYEDDAEGALLAEEPVDPFLRHVPLDHGTDRDPDQDILPHRPKHFRRLRQKNEKLVPSPGGDAIAELPPAPAPEAFVGVIFIVEIAPDDGPFDEQVPLAEPPFAQPVGDESGEDPHCKRRHGPYHGPLRSQVVEGEKVRGRAEQRRCHHQRHDRGERQPGEEQTYGGGKRSAGAQGGDEADEGSDEYTEDAVLPQRRLQLHRDLVRAEVAGDEDAGDKIGKYLPELRDDSPPVEQEVPYFTPEQSRERHLHILGGNEA